MRGLWKTESAAAGPIQRKLYEFPDVLDSLSPGVVWDMLHTS